LISLVFIAQKNTMH